MFLKLARAAGLTVTPLLIGIAIVTGLAGPAKSTNWDRVNYCNTYASEAVTANNQAKKLGCGFYASRWSSLPNGHRAWCMAVSNLDDTYAQAKLRYNCLIACKNKQYISPYCTGVHI